MCIDPATLTTPVRLLTLPRVGHFRVTAVLTGPTGRSQALDLFVDTGATLIVLPRAIAEHLELQLAEICPVELADGSEVSWPVADIRIALEGREAPTLCLVADRGEPLLGIVALESLRLAVDPVSRRLVPTRFLAKPSIPRPAVIATA
jgi:clan AA aspartic protease